MGGGPPAEVTIDNRLVQTLLTEQHPDLANLPLTQVGEGWDNVLFRLGEDLAVRLPRRAASAPMIEHEQRWLPELARRLPLPVPTPIRMGRPGSGFPWSWSVVRWLPGMTAVAELRNPQAVAASLGRFLRALHQPAPEDAPRSPFRSIPLDARTARLHEHLDQLGDVINRERVLSAVGSPRRDAALAGTADVDPRRPASGQPAARRRSARRRHRLWRHHMR